jgi:hypothetical protein
VVGVAEGEAPGQDGVVLDPVWRTNRERRRRSARSPASSAR